MNRSTLQQMGKKWNIVTTSYFHDDCTGGCRIIVVASMLARWVLTVLFGLLWLLVAIANAQLLWSKSKGKDEHASPVALLGALFAVAAFAAWPSRNPLKWLLLVPALVLDIGSGPIIVLGSASLLREGFHAFRKRIGRSSWIVNLGAGFFVWYLILGGALSESGVLQWILGLAAVVYWPALLIWLLRLRKHV